MKNILTIAVLLLCCQSVDAQGFLKKLKNAVEKELKEAVKINDTKENSVGEEKTKEINPPSSSNSEVKSDGIPTGNHGTSKETETLIMPKETATTKKIVLDDISAIMCGNFSCGLAFIKTKSNGCFYIDNQGNKVFTVSNKNIYYRSDLIKHQFGNDRVVDCIEQENGKYVYKARVLNTKGAVVKNLANIEKATNFVDGIAAVRVRSAKFGEPNVMKYINVNGEYVFPGLNVIGWYDDPIIRPLINGLAAFPVFDANRKKLWGFRDSNGKVVVKAEYLDVLDFSDGLAAVCKKVGEVEKWGYIDVTGKVVIPFTYTKKPSSFSDGYALVENKNEEQFYIDKTGTIVKGPYSNSTVPAISVSPFFNGHAIMSQFYSGNRTVYILDKSFNKVARINEVENSYSPEKEIAYEGSLGCYLNNDNFVEQNCFGCINYSISSLKGDLLYTGLASDFHEDIARNDVFENMTLIKVQYIKRNGEAIVVFVENEF